MFKLTTSLVGLIIVVVMGVFAWGVFVSLANPPQPPYFVESSTHKYILVKSGDIYYLPYIRDGKQHLVPVGLSEYDLSPYVNKTSTIEVDYPKNTNDLWRFTTNKQCIKGICIPNSSDLTTTFTTVNILRITK